MNKNFLLLSLFWIFLIPNLIFISAEIGNCNIFDNTSDTTCNANYGCSYAERNCMDFENNEVSCNLFDTCSWELARFSCSEFDNQATMCNVESPCIWHGDEPIPAYCEGEYPCENWGVGDCELEGCTWHPEEPVLTGLCEGNYSQVDECYGDYFNGTCAGTYFYEVEEVPFSVTGQSIYDSMNTAGAGLGIFMQIMSVALPLLVLGLGVVAVIVIIAYSLVGVLKRWHSK